MKKEQLFNYDLLWRRIVDGARRLGRETTRQLLLTYYVMTSRSTPRSEKLLLASAIAYVVLPIDLISARRLPVIGWIDEVVSLTVAYRKVRAHVTPEMEQKAESQLDKWFPDYVPYVEIEG